MIEDDIQQVRLRDQIELFLQEFFRTWREVRFPLD
jgi:hypothetical protein